MVQTYVCLSLIYTPLKKEKKKECLCLCLFVHIYAWSVQMVYGWPTKADLRFSQKHLSCGLQTITRWWSLDKCLDGGILDSWVIMTFCHLKKKKYYGSERYRNMDICNTIVWVETWKLRDLSPIRFMCTSSKRICSLLQFKSMVFKHMFVL